MSLEELLRSRVIRRTKPNHALAANSLKRAQRDIDTAKTLIENGNVRLVPSDFLQCNVASGQSFNV
jgi:hypothetical protein